MFEPVVVINIIHVCNIMGSGFGIPVFVTMQLWAEKHLPRLTTARLDKTGLIGGGHTAGLKIQ